MSERTERGTPDAAPGADAGAWTQVQQRQYEPADTVDLTTEIVFAIAAAEGVAPTALTATPLYDCVDAAALEETFFGPDSQGHSRRSLGGAEFRYEDYLVTVSSDGWIRVYEDGDGEGA